MLTPVVSHVSSSELRHGSLRSHTRRLWIPADGAAGGGGRVHLCRCVEGALLSLKPSVERVFGVKLSIGGEDGLSVQNGQIWLQLRGTAGDTQAAKVLYIPRCSVSVYLK